MNDQRQNMKSRPIERNITSPKQYDRNENLPLSVKQHLDGMDWSKAKDSFLENEENEMPTKQTMDDFDLSEMTNNNEFENIECNAKHNPMNTQDIRSDDHFIEQISIKI